MLDYLDAGCADHFARTRRYLEAVGTAYTINPRMVRGLDYYTRTTFELVTGLLGAQSAVAAGGRYDGLISDLGGPQLPGIGFAMGVERVALLLAEKEFKKRPDLFIAALGEAAQNEAFRLMTGLQRLGVSRGDRLRGKEPQEPDAPLRQVQRPLHPDHRRGRTGEGEGAPEEHGCGNAGRGGVLTRKRSPGG